MEPRLLAALAVAVLAYGVVSRLAERSPITAPIVFVLLGLALGGGGFGWMELDVSHGVVHGLAELTLILVLFIDASRIDLSCLWRERGLPLRLLGVGLPLTIVMGALAARAVFPEIPLAQALLLAAILAPTDAALGQAVVSSPLLPVCVRQGLNVESGLNDGIALPVVLIFAALAGAHTDHVVAEGALGWAGFVFLQLTLGPLVGAAVGFVGGRIVGAATTRGWVNEAFGELASLGLAMLAFAGAELLNGNGFISAFVAGLVVGNTARGLCKSLHEFGEAQGQLLGLLVFLVFGAVLVPQAWPHVDARTWIYALLSLTLVRMLPVALSLLGAGMRPASFAFLGWFGPRGLASILFALLVVGEATEWQQIAATVTWTVLLSTFLHGLTAYPLARVYGAYLANKRVQAAAEHRVVTEHPVRHRHAAAATR